MRKNLVYILDYVRVLFKRIFCVPTLSRLTTPERWKEGISFLKILLCKKGSFPLLRISVYLFVIYISLKVKKYILYTFHPICRLDEPFIVSNILYTFLYNVHDRVRKYLFFIIQIRFSTSGTAPVRDRPAPASAPAPAPADPGPAGSGSGSGSGSGPGPDPV